MSIFWKQGVCWGQYLDMFSYNIISEPVCVEAVSSHTQFNTRLSSSTPDPDRLFVDLDQQLIPERDTSSPLWKTVLVSQQVAATKGKEISILIKPVHISFKII